MSHTLFSLFSAGLGVLAFLRLGEVFVCDVGDGSSEAAFRRLSPS